MKGIRKLFGGINMTWPKVIIFALVAAGITVAFNLIPIFEGTSFQDIAVNLECWILFAVFIIVNCEKWWEAGLKCIVFFLISQPLIYLLEVPILGWDVFQYYRYWFIITLFTFPGGAIGFFLKKRNWFSAVLLAITGAALGLFSAQYMRSVVFNFPYHIISAIFCLALAVFFAFVFLDKRKQQIIVLVVTAAVFIGYFVYSGRNDTKQIMLDEGTWSCTQDTPGLVDVSVNGEVVTINARKTGNVMLTFTNENGEIKEYYVTVSGGGLWIDDLSDL